jgi:hypothetical protein
MINFDYGLLGFLWDDPIMPKLRFNIASLLGVILVLGIAFAALRESNDLWESGVFTLTLTALLISIVLAVHRTESRRAFWFGFALFGSTYVALSLMPAIESRLITTKSLAYVRSKMFERSLKITKVRHSGNRRLVSTMALESTSQPVQNVAFTKDGKQLVTTNKGTVRVWDVATGRLLGGWSGTTENFVRIGHSLLSLIAAMLGGYLSHHFYAQNGTKQTVIMWDRRLKSEGIA